MPQGWADDEEDSDEDAEDDKAFFGMDNDGEDDDKKVQTPARRLVPEPFGPENVEVLLFLWSFLVFPVIFFCFYCWSSQE